MEYGMKLPSYLARSRHGVFYFRITYLFNSIRKEKRWSLHTKNPIEAKQLSLKICATLDDNAMVKNIASRVDNVHGDPRPIANERPRDSIKMANDKNNHAELITTIQSPNGGTIRLEIDQSDPADVAAAQALAKTFIQENTQVPDPSNWNWQGGLNAIKNDIVQDVIAVNTIKVGAGIDVLISRYLNRKDDNLAKKTIYEYEKMQRRFAAWIKSESGVDEVALNTVETREISIYIDKLKSDGITLRTIQTKHLAALNGLFGFAQSTGDYPKGDLPTKGHKLFTRSDQKKRTKLKLGWEPFSNEDLTLIFKPGNLLALDKPCDYWLPLLAIFTGGRLSELCQLKPNNIRQIDGIWAIDINEDDEDQSIKTPAGIRIIPLHPKLIELGILDYVEVVRPYGGTIFPYLTPDRFKNYGKTPGRRFGEYLDTLGITNDRKVFHSFRSTSNDRLKKNGVPEESRCQFVGHEHDTVNSKDYSKAFDVKFLLENVAIHLTFDHLEFNKLHYPSETFNKKLHHLMKNVIKNREHKKAVEAREAKKADNA